MDALGPLVMVTYKHTVPSWYAKKDGHLTSGVETFQHSPPRALESFARPFAKYRAWERVFFVSR